MCEWNENKGMGDSQSILFLPDNIDENRQNREVCVDKCIQHVILHLWHHNINTLGCCCGHGKPELGGCSVIIADSYKGRKIRKIIRQVDNRQWTILQWRLEKI
jgi:S-adenosylmethionine synthetase